MSTQFVQLAPETRDRRAKVVDRYNAIKVHMDLIMSMLIDKRLSSYQFQLYESMLKILSEQIAGKDLDKEDADGEEGEANQANYDGSVPSEAFRSLEVILRRGHPRVAKR